ncbi:uncharacterized protein LOC110450829 isoform X3 [Mizuhopecten yessoensis]|uniref:Uncharacterized protein n=1 Tax=Mizuhopecten yessoensis TaxID=6573 RepID=A0A210QN13_MIZYE|nr:uncharacterized protein LOC110450829 isoform X3 [Mizuhopecten yessoensis]OWF50130.1 hypothetical protein KP79_PYT14089 [Mizuhopecten yessoensis]
METQRNYDVQAAERIFRKVVHPGLDSMRIVDRNGMPITSAPSGYTNYLRNKTFSLSPRGVPTRVSNHTYSGKHSHISRYGPSMPGSDSPEMYVMQASAELKSAKLNRPYTHSSVLPSRKRAMSNTSKTTLSMRASRSTSSRNATMPGEKRQMKSAHSEHWNKSEQGQRLNREWSGVSDSRALKRSSEILSHRVDRMYFMNGNNIRLKSKYLVDEEELLHLRDTSKSRQYSNQPRRFIRPRVNFMDNYRELFRSSSPSPSIEDGHSSVTPSISPAMPLAPRPMSSCQMCNHNQNKPVPKSVSEESGIQDDDWQEEDIEVAKGEPEVTSESNNSRPVSKVKIKHIQVHDTPLSIIDILSHGEMQALGDCMVKLLENYPQPKKVRTTYEDVIFNNMGLKHRRTRINRRVYGNQNSHTQNYKKISHSAPPPKTAQRTDHKSRSLSSDRRNRNRDLAHEELLQKFPKRKPNSRIMMSQITEPVECDCRKTLPGGGLSFKISGTQAPIFLKIAANDCKNHLDVEYHLP